jgi:hypothetical protein
MTYQFLKSDENTRFWLEFQVCSSSELGSQKAEAGNSTPGRFSHFNDLPPEIRLQIWGYLIEARTVIVACLDPDHLDEKRQQLARRPKQHPVPALLHVNHETRELALQHYELTFSWKIPYMLVSGSGRPPLKADARVWFNFELDCVLLLGELEPFDSYGFNTPMVYFLKKEDTRKVKHIACAFEELHYGESESEHIFGCLFHILDRFPSAERLLITSTLADLETRHLILPPRDNIIQNPIQKLWWAWINGMSVVTSSLADTQILMIQESELESFIAKQT